MNVFSQPWMVKNFVNVPCILPLASYFIIFCATWILNKKYSKEEYEKLFPKIKEQIIYRRQRYKDLDRPRGQVLPGKDHAE